MQNPEDHTRNKTTPDELNPDSLIWSSKWFSIHQASWGAFLLVLALFVLLPLLPAASTALDEWQVKLPLTFTQLVSPGELSGGHKLFGKQCRTCHQQPLRAVSDSACQSCHKQVNQHVVSSKTKTTQHDELPCIACHEDHKGELGLISHWNDQCLNCHNTVRTGADNRPVGRVNNFAVDHPQFQLSVIGNAGVVSRMLNKREITEHPELKFSHKLHLDKKGISTPLGEIMLSCKDCHRLEQEAPGFAPLTMQSSCQLSHCHSQDYAEPAFGSIPHGNLKLALAGLEDKYLELLKNGEVSQASCASDTGKKILSSRDCAHQLALKNAETSMVRGNLLCTGCHTVIPNADENLPWKIIPPALNRDWYPVAQFSHRKHETQSCTHCHDKENSKNSGEVSIPGIETCRECHADESPNQKQIRTSCDNCHRYHSGKPAVK